MYPAVKTYVGADIAQASVVFCGPKAATIENTPAALRAYLATLPADAHLVCEATGRHHYALQQACAEKGLPLTCLNPAHARAFARSLGKHEKTDTLDAALLRQFGQERRPTPTAPPEPGRHGLLDLLMLRTAVVGDICDYRRRDSLLDATTHKQLRSVIALLLGRQKQIEALLSQWLENAPEHWQHRVQTLCLIKGVGVLSALQLAGYLPELGTCNRRQIAKLAGLAPLPWDSGKLQGVRHIQHGRAPARRVLYQCAVVAARWNETLRPHYQQLRARGMPAKKAYVAVARKLLVCLNAALRPGQAAGR
jgi:transposase